MGGSAHKVHYHVFWGASDLQPTKTHKSGDCCRNSPSELGIVEVPIFVYNFYNTLKYEKMCRV